MNIKKQHGAFSWNELMTTDTGAAKKFYGTLFGWNLDEMQVGDMEYTIVKANDTEIAGIMGMPPEAAGMPPHWGAYVTVDDVDASAKEVEALGGKIILPPKDIPDVGRFCVICDPQDATLSMISYCDK